MGSELQNELANLTNRPQNTNKYDFGHVLIVGGSLGMEGAPFLAAEAALKVGVGLVTVACPSSVAQNYQKSILEIMSLPLPETSKETIARTAVLEVVQFIKSRKVNAIVIGPGLSREPDSLDFCRNLISRLEIPTVVDADAIIAWQGHLKELIKASKHNPNLVFTPHLGEFQKLVSKTLPKSINSQTNTAKGFSRTYQVYLILKQHQNIIAFPHSRPAHIAAGNPGMATAGAGDVLSGIIAGLLAQKVEISIALQLGVIIHGTAGNLAALAKTEPGMIASDISKAIPEAIKQLIS